MQILKNITSVFSSTLRAVSFISSFSIISISTFCDCSFLFKKSAWFAFLAIFSSSVFFTWPKSFVNRISLTTRRTAFWNLFLGVVAKCLRISFEITLRHTLIVHFKLFQCSVAKKTLFEIPIAHLFLLFCYRC